MSAEDDRRQAAEYLRLSMPLAQRVVTLEACLLELIRLLVAKEVLGAQEVLDELATLSDSILHRPDGVEAVLTLERLCTELAKLPGAKRPSA